MASSTNIIDHTHKQTNLLFEKRTVIELSENEMVQVDGGTNPFALSVAIGIGAYLVYQYLMHSDN
jgi:lactobin A/cerein 7B family class IIb bacteriocin